MLPKSSTLPACPGRITEVSEEGLLRQGAVDFGGTPREVCLAYVPEAGVGDWVLVHVGFAISHLSEEEVLEAVGKQLGIPVRPRIEIEGIDESLVERLRDRQDFDDTVLAAELEAARGEGRADHAKRGPISTGRQRTGIAMRQNTRSFIQQRGTMSANGMAHRSIFFMDSLRFCQQLLPQLIG